MDQQDNTAKLIIRLPRDVKDWLEREAARHLSTQSSECVRAIRARMDAEQRAG
jgi:hypothetical protein